MARRPLSSKLAVIVAVVAIAAAAALVVAMATTAAAAIMAADGDEDEAGAEAEVGVGEGEDDERSTKSRCSRNLVAGNAFLSLFPENPLDPDLAALRVASIHIASSETRGTFRKGQSKVDRAIQYCRTDVTNKSSAMVPAY